MAATLETETLLSPQGIAEELRTTKAELAGTLGLSREALIRQDRIRSVRVQTRLRELVEILNTVAQLHAEEGGLLVPYAWFRSQPLPGLGLKTPDTLVREGEARLVQDYLADVAQGVYA